MICPSSGGSRPLFVNISLTAGTRRKSLSHRLYSLLCNDYNYMYVYRKYDISIQINKMLFISKCQDVNTLSLSLKLFSHANYLHICMKHQKRHSINSKMYFSLNICIRKLEVNNHLSLRGVWGTSMEDATQAWIRVTSYDGQCSDNLRTNPSTERTWDRKRLAMLKS